MAEINSKYEMLRNELQIKWTQNDCELGKRHSKRGKKMVRARGKHHSEESV
jgi:hypothetical protein